MSNVLFLKIVIGFLALLEGYPSIPETAPITDSILHDETTAEERRAAPTFYSVASVTDGDTFRTFVNGKSEAIRLIGVDTPETVHPTKDVQCLGKEAGLYAEAVLGGKKIRLEQDPTQGERDKYGRLLAYAFLEDGTDVGRLLLEQGYAYEYTYNIPYKYQLEYKRAQRDASNSKRGLWADDACANQVNISVPEKEVVPVPISTPKQEGPSYSCSSNIYNCGDFSTHTQAQNVYLSCGGTSNDVHQLDGDHDGEACESLP